MEEQDYNHGVLTKEIIGYTPRWIVKWGITMIFASLVCLAIVLYSIKYPVSIILTGSLEYEIKPTPLLITENSILLHQSVQDSILTGKGSEIMALESIADKRKYFIYAPLAGKLYFYQNWKAQSFVGRGQILGFIIPQPNDRILHLKTSYSKFSNLKKGQKLKMRILFLNQTSVSTEGTIDYISPQLGDKSFIDIRLINNINKEPFFDGLTNSIYKIDCSVNLTIDTVNYLQHIFRPHR